MDIFNFILFLILGGIVGLLFAIVQILLDIKLLLKYHN